MKLSHILCSVTFFPRESCCINQGYRHTLGICSTDCFLKATFVTRTLLHVTLHVHFLFLNNRVTITTSRKALLLGIRLVFRGLWLPLIQTASGHDSHRPSALPDTLLVAIHVSSLFSFPTVCLCSCLPAKLTSKLSYNWYCRNVRLFFFASSLMETK